MQSQKKRADTPPSDRREPDAAAVARAVGVAGVGVWDFDLRSGEAFVSGVAIPPDPRYAADPRLLIDDPLGVVAASDREAVRLAREAHWRGETPEFRAVYRYAALGPTGRVWVEAVGRLERDDTGRPVRFTGVVHDVTARQAAHDDLARAKQAAEHAAAAKDRFLSMISHELRTPLNVIVNFARLALREAPAGRVREMMAAVVRGGDRITAVIESILDFSALEEGQYRLECEPFRFDETVRAAVGAVRDVAEAKGLALSVTIKDGADEPVLGDSLRVRKILLNLIENAVKFTDDGEVSVTVSRDDAGMMVDVADTGPGVPRDLADAVFDPFRQADIGITRAHGGLGLGLTVATRLATLMGGGVTLARLGAPARGRAGACFRVRLPLPAAHGDDTHRAANDQSRLMDVLVVDDNDTNRKLMDLLLGGLGHRVTLAVNGVEAVSAARKQSFDVILMDLHMPRMDGFDAARAIRALDPPVGDVPILALTADSRADVATHIREAGMDGLLTKPVSAEQLKSALHRFDAAGAGHAPAGGPAETAPRRKTPPDTTAVGDRGATATGGRPTSEADSGRSHGKS